MTDDEFTRDRAVLAAALPGPYIVNVVPRPGLSLGLAEFQIHKLALTSAERERNLGTIIYKAEAIMMALARERWPAALDEIERLRTKLALTEALLKTRAL